MWSSNSNNRLFHVVVVLQLSLCMSNYRWITTTTLHSNNNNQKTNYHKKYWTIYLDVSVCDCCYVIFLLFICYCRCTMADEQQEQQCETVTTTITQRNLYKLLSVGELIFEIDWRSDAPPANWTETYRAWLHQISYQYSTMYIYPGQMYPPLIKLRAREPDYTK